MQRRSIEHEQIIYVSSNRRMKQLMHWLSNSHSTPDTGILTYLLSTMAPKRMETTLPSTALFRGIHLSSAGLEKTDGTRKPRSLKRSERGTPGYLPLGAYYVESQKANTPALLPALTL